MATAGGMSRSSRLASTPARFRASARAEFGRVEMRPALPAASNASPIAEAEWAEFGEHFQVDTRITPVVAPTEIKIAESLPPVGAPPSRL